MLPPITTLPSYSQRDLLAASPGTPEQQLQLLLAAYAQIFRRSGDTRQVLRQLFENAAKPKGIPTLEDQFAGLMAQALLEKNRRRKIRLLRQARAWLMRRVPGLEV